MGQITVEEYLDLKDQKYLDKDIAKKFNMQQSKLSTWKNSISVMGKIEAEKRRRIAEKEKKDPVKPAITIRKEGEKVEPLRSKVLEKATVPKEQKTTRVTKENSTDKELMERESIEIEIDIEEVTDQENDSSNEDRSLNYDPSNEEYENLLKQLSAALKGTPIELPTPANDELIEYRLKTHSQAEEIDHLKKEVYDLDHQLQNHIKKSDSLYKENMKLKAETIALRKLVELYIPAIS